MLRVRGFWGALGLFTGLLVLAYLGAPRVEHFSPNPQSLHVSASAPIRISFNRPMDRVSVETRLSISPEIPGRFSWEGSTVVYRPAGAWQAGTTVQVGLRAGARSTLFLPILRSLTWSFEVGKPRLSYLWPADSVPDLYIHDLASGETERITRTEAGVMDYSVAGATVYYAELRADGSSALRAIDLETGADRTLHECPPAERCRSPAVDPSGTQLAFEWYAWEVSESGQRVPGPTQVRLLPLDGDAEPRPLAPAGQSLKTPMWSPAGQLAYYNATLQAIGLIRADSGSPPELIPNGLGLLGSWSPDGRYLVLPEIVFPETEAAGQPDFVSHLYRIDALSTAVSELSQGPVEDASPSYSPDGQWIAFARKYLDGRWTPGRQLWLMRADGSQSRPLTQQPDFSHSAISWSLDSSTLAFMQRSQTDTSLPPQIWISDRTGEQQRMLVDGGFLPLWLP